MKHVARALLLASIALTAVTAGVRAQDEEDFEPEGLEPDGLEGLDLGAIQAIAMPGMEGTPEEVAAWSAAREGRHIRAREMTDRILRASPQSFAGEFVLGYVYYHGEANFPRALFHLDRAYELYRARFGDPPRSAETWRWHAQILQYLAWVHGDLEHYEEQLAWMARYNDIYDPDLIAEMAWPLMKLRRFDDARAAARAAEATGQMRQVEVALNALCAVEFEAGDNEAGYRSCRAAMELHGGSPALQSAVDFTNFAEAARSVFRLDEAERVDLQATQAQTSWYGNPHVELAELYVRQGRFVEALESMRQVPAYRARRPPHVRDSDRNEARRVLAEFFLVIGRPDDAIRITHRALIAPDRRGHNSRDPAQDVAIAALLDRRARAMAADRLLVSSLGAPMHERAWAWMRALAYRFEAWTSGRQAARALADDSRLVGTFMVGTSRSAVLPPWLAGELVDVLGPGVALESVRRARAQDRRSSAPPYYDAFEAEAALLGGDPARARELAARALEGLQPAETLLRARAYAIAAEAARREGDTRRALESYDEAFQIDPGIFLRMELTVPVRIVTRGGDVADEVGSMLAWSPRFDVEDVGLQIEIEADAHLGRACLIGASGSVLACADEEARASEGSSAFAGRLASAFHAAAFAPRVDLTQADANSLDGSNTVSRQPLETLFGVPGGDDAPSLLDPE